MKNFKYTVLFLLMFFISNIYVYASCANEELLDLKKKANDIKVSYKHLGLVESGDGNSNYNSFSVVIKNIDDDFYLNATRLGGVRLEPNDGEIKLILETGKWNINIYSDKCDVLVDNIEFKLPRFNMYSLDPLCKGIDGNDFRLCGKYYEYDVSYENFVDRVTYYRSVNKIYSSDKKDDNNDNNLFNNVLDFLMRYKLYVIITLSILLVLLFILLIIRKRRRMGVLK